MAKKPVKKNDKPVVGYTKGDVASNGVSANRVFVAMARTINIGNYESIRVEYAEGRAVADGEDWAEARSTLMQTVAVELTTLADAVEAQFK